MARNIAMCTTIILLVTSLVIASRIDANTDSTSLRYVVDEQARTGAASLIQVRGRREIQLPSDIPKIIHQTWKTSQVPATFQRWSQTWKDCLPDWEFKLHTDEDNREIFAKYFPELLSTYDGYPEGIMRADVSRLAYMATDGGLYVDLDIECLRSPFDVVSQSDRFVLACEGGHQVSNAFMMGGESAKTLYRELLSKLPEESKQKSPLYATGPMFMSKHLGDFVFGNLMTANGESQRLTLQNGNVSAPGVVLADATVFGMPWNANESMKNLSLNRDWVTEHYPNSIAFSHWTGTWLGNPVPNVSSLLVVTQAEQCRCLLAALSEQDAAPFACQAYIQNRLTNCQGRSCLRILMQEYSDACV
jgi:hypothetical protein